ncbi:MAG: hypothetical protein EBU66_17695 [Bacteroidetes bacterium]|nr:hypothetical protein [Bacteroidota bacterium]
MIKDFLSAKGVLSIVVRDENGDLKQQYDATNLVVDAGLAYIASRMKDTTKTAMSHMAIGSGSTAPAAGNTSLGSQLGRVALTSTTVTANSVAYVASFPAGTGTGAVTEAGIFNASSGGDMLCRTTFDVINKAAGDSMTITWTVTVE